MTAMLRYILRFFIEIETASLVSFHLHIIAVDFAMSAHQGDARVCVYIIFMISNQKTLSCQMANIFSLCI